MSRAELVVNRIATEELWRLLESRLLELEQDHYTGHRPWVRRKTAAAEARRIVRELQLRGTQLALFR